MTAVDVLVWIGAALGAALALYGVWILLTGRAPARTRQAFRSVTEAGLYSLCNGSGLVLLVISSRFGEHLGTGVRIALLCLAILLCGVAFVRYRPRNPARR